MEAIVKSNIEFLIDNLSIDSDVRQNLYLIRALRIILVNDSPTWWEEAMLELGKVIDSVRINKCEMAPHVVISKLDFLLPHAVILESTWYIHRTWKNPHSKESVKQSVLKIQSEHVNKAKAKLDKFGL